MAPKKQQNSFLKNLALRVVTAAVLIPLVLFAVLKGGYYFRGLLIFITLLLGYEYKRLAQLSGKTRAVFTAGVIAVMWWLFAMTYKAGIIDGIQVAAIAGVTVIGVGVILKKMRVCWAGFGMAYIGIPMFSLALIGMHPAGADWLIWMLAVVWGTDTGAYLFGKAIGGPKLVPRISPNKTWAGLGGGVIVAAAAAGIAAHYVGLDEAFYLAFGGALLALWAQLGDMAESFTKRKFGAKDSGYLIPGHGGLLDRVDGLLFVAPALALFLELTA